MEVVTAVAALRARVREARRSGQEVGLVPTMGAFHEGHLSLIRRARSDGGLVVVSLFVNPMQFGPNEDLSSYPRPFEADRALAEAIGVDVLFAPPADEVYRPDAGTTVEVTGLTAGLCGASRPTHFRGVTTVVAKLFHMALPDRAYFGEKDYQQLQVIRQMVRDLDFPLGIVPCPLVREPDGLAMSSRNRLLSPAERAAALSLSRGLFAARERFTAGEREAAPLLAAAREPPAGEPLVRPDYLELVDAEDLHAVSRADAPAVLAAAAFVGNTRLIDNVILRP